MATTATERQIQLHTPAAATPLSESFSSNRAELQSTRPTLASSLTDQQFQRIISSTAIPEDQKKDILRDLNAIAATPSTVLSAAQRDQWVNLAITHITAPNNVNQGMYATCTVTSQQFLLAETNPAEYVRLTRGLALNGQAELAMKGEFIRIDPPPQTQDALAALPPYQARDPLEIAMQTALMRYAIPEMNYDFRTDTFRGKYMGNGPFEFQGLPKEAYHRSMCALFNRNYTRPEVKSGADRDQMIEQITENSRREGGTLVEINYASTGIHALHEVVVKSIDRGVVTFYNPHGGTSEKPGAIQQMTLADFRKNLSSALIAESDTRPSISSIPEAVRTVPRVQPIEKEYQGEPIQGRYEFQMAPPSAEISELLPHYKVVPPAEQVQLKNAGVQIVPSESIGEPHTDVRAAHQAALRRQPVPAAVEKRTPRKALSDDDQIIPE